MHQAATYNIHTFYEYEGVTVFPPTEVTESLVKWSDIIITHLEYTNWTIHIGMIYKKPVVFISHNTHVYSCINEWPQTAVIYNCNAMREVLKYKNRNIILHPPVDIEKYNVNPDPGKSPYITIINCNENKGGKIFSKLAKAMPDKKFLAVKGSYEEQYIPDLPNVTIWDNSPDILPTYRLTRILIMPSRYESWGMTASEAYCSGIPVIATPTFGLKENCAEAGIFMPERGELIFLDAAGNVLPDEKWSQSVKVVDDENTYDIDPLIKLIKMLDDPKVYKLHSEKCRKRASEYQPIRELEELESFLLSL